MKVRIMLGKCDTCGALSAIDDEASLNIGDPARVCGLMYDNASRDLDCTAPFVVCQGQVIYVAYLKEIGE